VTTLDMTAVVVVHLPLSVIIYGPFARMEEEAQLKSPLLGHRLTDHSGEFTSFGIADA